ncbi:MAG TPA: non-heme iron oxygenase ferredoxin subunit [bacterium]|nr:non-heme iron oxygenase ferredoxin subunit [bacterium]
MSEFVRVGRVADLTPGSVMRVEVAGHAVALANVDGEFFAVDDTCTHEEASLAKGGLLGEVLICPKHGSRFNVKTGRVLSLPAVRSVSVYPVRVEGDDVLVSPNAHTPRGMPHRR